LSCSSIQVGRWEVKRNGVSAPWTRASPALTALAVVAVHSTKKVNDILHPLDEKLAEEI